MPYTPEVQREVKHIHDLVAPNANTLNEQLHAIGRPDANVIPEVV